MTVAYVEEKVEAVIDILDRHGYWALCNREASQWGSVYILLCLPPISMHTSPRKTPYLIRVSDHPTRPDKEELIAASVHPGKDDVAKMWRSVKAQIAKDIAAKKEEATRKAQAEQLYYKYKSMRKKS